MAIFAGAFPVLPGMDAAVKQFSKELGTTRKKDFERSEKRLGVKRESWFLQTTPQGSWIIVHFEAKDVNRALSDFAKSTDPFDVWYRDQIKQVTGMDMAAPMSGPMPEQLLAYGY